MACLNGKKRNLFLIAVIGLVVCYVALHHLQGNHDSVMATNEALHISGSDIRPLEDYLTGNFTTRPLQTMGCKTPVKNVPGISLTCGNAIDMDKRLGLSEKRNNFYNLMLRTTAKCDHPELLGKAGDGGWFTCKQEPYLFKKPCLVYSFGIAKDWSFDDTVSKKYGCEVHSFDPSIGLQDHKHSDLVSFHNTGLSGRNEITTVKGVQWKIRTLCTLIRELGHSNRTIDYLKFDVEFSEWSALISMLDDGCLRQVKQLSLEAHAWGDTSANYTMFWWGLHGLENMGFQKWRVLNRQWRCFRPKDEPHKARCPQTDMNYINAHYLPS